MPRRRTAMSRHMRRWGMRAGPTGTLAVICMGALAVICMGARVHTNEAPSLSSGLVLTRATTLGCSRYPILTGESLRRTLSLKFWDRLSRASPEIPFLDFQVSSPNTPRSAGLIVWLRLQVNSCTVHKFVPVFLLLQRQCRNGTIFQYDWNKIEKKTRRAHEKLSNALTMLYISM